jgi:hypothetical protein
MMPINYRAGVSIGVLVVYIPIFFVAIFLAIRHGISISAGWRFLVIFALIRLVGACFEIRTLADPTNTGLYIGIAILQNIGLAPLELASMGLLSRVITSINLSKRTIIQPSYIKALELIVLVALVLGIVGGVESSGSFTKTGQFTTQAETKAALGLLIATYAAIVLITITTYFHIQHAENGERRILLAVALSLPFMLVRLIYSSMYSFGGHKNFSSLSGSVTLFLVLALIMEIIVVIIYLAVGVTLKRIPKHQSTHKATRQQEVPLEHQGSLNSNSGLRQKEAAQQPSGLRKTGDFLAKYTIIGRIFASRR